MDDVNLNFLNLQSLINIFLHTELKYNIQYSPT